MKIMLSLLLVLVTASFAIAQEQPEPTADPIEQLRLTPDQRQAVRQIVADTKLERQSINRRLREANVALDQALDAEPADENLIERRINEVAAAHAAQLRMRIHTEMKIRRILNPEQLGTLRRLRLQMRDVIAPQRRNNPRRPAAQQDFRPRR
jgi:Spy/CpxP family protein refolding chaperone